MENYRSRLCEERVLQLAKFFKVILVTGARQVGKSSLLAHLFPEVRSFVFDPLQDLYNARRVCRALYSTQETNATFWQTIPSHCHGTVSNSEDLE